MANAQNKTNKQKNTLTATPLQLWAARLDQGLPIEIEGAAAVLDSCATSPHPSAMLGVGKLNVVVSGAQTAVFQGSKAQRFKRTYS